MIIEIPIFDGGLLTNVDPEDIPSNASSETENFDIDVVGKLLKRKGLQSKGTLTGDHLTQLFYWTDTNLAGGANWIGYESQSYQIVKYNKDFSTPVVLKTFSSPYPSDIKIIPMANSLRFANGHDQDVGFLQYIDREFFFGAHTYDALKYDSASPVYPTTWELNYVETLTGKLATGAYYYKAVPLFDGVQEAPFQDQFVKKIQGAGNVHANHISLKIDEDDYNPRITGVNIYRHFNATDNIQPVYRLIKTINLATKATSTEIESGNSNANIGRAIYFPDGGVTNAIDTLTGIAVGASSSPDYIIKLVAGSTTYILKNDENSGTTATYTDNLITLNTTLPDGQDWWAETVAITMSYDEEGEASVQNATSNVTGGYGGRDVVYDTRSSGYWDFSINQKNDWIISIASQSNLSVLNSVKRVMQLNADSATLGVNQTVGNLTNGYYFEAAAGNLQTLHVIDVGGINDRVHRLTTTKNKVNYKHGAFVNGRFFAGDVALDPDVEDEIHEDFLIFSPINQPDILPVSNFIQIKDSQGGNIVAMRRLNDNLVIFMERGVYQLYAPAGNPQNYSLRESDVNIGCVATNSIVEAGQYIFFAGNDNIYMTGSGMSSVPVSTAIKDVYTSSANLDQTIGIYDPLKNRILFRFGSDGTKVYALDYLRIGSGQEVWNKLTFEAAKSVDLISIDADLKVYTTHNES
jgi:hypothetical protein